ncbi:MAG: DUF481 domain-containing protein [Pyrinomonadaceae bacterium]
MKKKIYWIFVPAILCSFALQIAAGEITLKNGDRLTGKIVEESDEAVVIETEYAGKVRVARSFIEKLTATTAEAEPAAEAKPTAETKPVEPKSATAETDASVTPPAAAKAKNSDGIGNRLRKFAAGWDGNANIGFSYTNGNAKNVTMATSFRAAKVSPNDGLMIYVRSLWNSNHGSHVTTQNAYWGGARYDRTIDKRVFGFISYDFERDKPKKLNFRSVVGGGIGHRTIKNDRTQLEFLVGGAWNRTWRDDGGTDTPEGLAGFTLKQKLNHRLRFQNSFTYFQNVTDKHEFRSLLDATLTVDITPRIGFIFSVGDRFNNDPIGTSQKNDFLFTTGLKWSFGKKK